MNNKTLGTLALIGAPFLLLGMHLEQTNKTLADSWFTGVWGIIYITAWMASITALRQLQATGTSRFGKNILWVITGTLILANLSNVHQLLAPTNKSTLFFVLDAFWPISNLIMFVVGITVVRANVLTGWHRFVPLLVGCWFPLTVLGMVTIGRDAPIMVLVPYYSAVAWSLLALVILTPKKTPTVNQVNSLELQSA